MLQLLLLKFKTVKRPEYSIVIYIMKANGIRNQLLEFKQLGRRKVSLRWFRNRKLTIILPASCWC